MMRFSSTGARLIPLFLIVFATAGHAADRRTTRQAELVLQIKRLQQQRLLGEGLERCEERRSAAPSEFGAAARRHEDDSRAIGSARGEGQRPFLGDGHEAGQSLFAQLFAHPAARQGAASFAANVMVSDPALDAPSRADAQAEPSIAAWNNDVMAGWNDGRGAMLDSSVPSATLPNTMNYGYSTDGGLTFITGPASGPAALPVPLLGGAWTSDPVIAVNEKTGEFYFCGLFDPVNGFGAGETGLAVARATISSSTITWAAGSPSIVTRWSGFTNNIDKCWMVADSLSGNLYVTYTHFNYSAGSDSILFTRSTDKGAHWSPGVILSSVAAAGLVQGSRPAVAPMARCT